MFIQRIYGLHLGGMGMCEFCSQFEQLPQMHGKLIFADGTLSFCEFTELGTGISWRNIGEIRMDFYQSISVLNVAEI